MRTPTNTAEPEVQTVEIDQSDECCIIENDLNSDQNTVLAPDVADSNHNSFSTAEVLPTEIIEENLLIGNVYLLIYNQ